MGRFVYGFGCMVVGIPTFWVFGRHVGLRNFDEQGFFVLGSVRVWLMLDVGRSCVSGFIA